MSTSISCPFLGSSWSSLGFWGTKADFWCNFPHSWEMIWDYLHVFPQIYKSVVRIMSGRFSFDLSLSMSSTSHIFQFVLLHSGWQYWTDRGSPSSVFLAEFKSAALLFLTSDRSDKKNNPLNCCAMLCFPLWYVDSRHVTFLLQAITIPWSPLRSPEKAVTRALLSDTSGSPWRCKGWKETKWN